MGTSISDFVAKRRPWLWPAALIGAIALSSCDGGPGDPYAAARDAMAAGEPRTASQFITEALEQRAGDPEVRLLAGDIAMAMGNSDRAVSEFERLVDGPGASPLAKAKLAEAHLMANNIRAARASVEALGFEVPLAYTAAIGFDLWQGENEAAYAKLAEGLERFPEDPRLVAIDAERLFASAQPDAARDRLEPVLALQPAVAQAHRLAGQMALSHRDFSEASQHFNAVLKARPNDQTAMLAMAAIARDSGDTNAAANWINKANSAGPPHPIGLLFAAQMAFDAGDIGRAYELIEKVPPAMASEASFARLRGFVDAARGQHGAAILPLKSYLEKASDDYTARRVLAEAYAQQGELDNAWATIAPVLQDPRAERVALMLALQLSEQTGRGDKNRIRALLEKRAIAADYANAMQEASAAIRGGDWAKAEAIYAPLIEGAGKADPMLLNNAAAVQAKLGDYSEAVTYARRALAQAPESPQILDTLGWALWQAGGDKREARRLLTQAREKAPDNREIAEHWAIAHQDA